MALAVFTAFVGLLAAPVRLDPLPGFIAILAIAVGAGAAGALNMWYDAVMARTVMRPTELACLVCRSPEAVEQFLSFCGCQAFDLLAEHATALMSMHIILRMRRTMSGAELDDAIASVLAHQGVARERLRRKEWQRVVERAAAFEREHVITRTR
jgi:hypothetical protein